jgi:ribosomal protein S18 acetylase RimI-like enzyme
MNSGMSIRRYKSGDQSCFEAFNRQWIEEFFEMEPVDNQVLKNPDVHILASGGAIHVVCVGNVVVGTVALKYVGPTVFEFTKMAVDRPYRGRKIGKAHAVAAIKLARESGAESIVLYSNTILASAIALYKSLGFVEMPLDGPYKRSNIKMELLLTM